MTIINDQATRAAFEAARGSLTKIWAAALGKDVPPEVIGQLYNLTQSIAALADELGQPRSEELDTMVKLLKDAAKDG
jgi:hypothetical protein